MKDTIVFCLEAGNEESYGEIANFIYKREKQIIITKREVQRVSYKYYLKNINDTNKVWAQTILSDIRNYKRIHEPNKIKNITNKYEIIYCIYVDENTDIIDLYNLFLIKQHYTDLNIIVLFPNCNDNQYFIISQFLYSVNLEDDKFYNECYFLFKGNLQRLQRNNISFSRFFTPLQIVNKENLKRLFRECKEIITTDYLQAIPLRMKTENEGYNDLIDGAIKILCDVKKFSPRLYEYQFVQVFQKMDVMAFVLLCYVICQKNEELNLSLLERYAFQMQQYSNAVRQLAENIVFHSKTGCGIIALRLHDKKSSYINDKYQVEDKESSFLEIIVSDFCRDNSSGNIADNFISNLQDDRIKIAFKEMKPRAFFDHENDNIIKSAWEEFYQNPNNIGKHFGLRIFQSVVSTFGGVFGAESHSGYINLPGDSYLSYNGNEMSTCMPGTRYHIVFPIERVQVAMKKQDLSLDSGINIGTRINKYLTYSVGEMNLSGKFEIHQSQVQKMNKLGK